MQKQKQLTPKLVTAIISAGIMAFAGVVAETAMNITFPTLMREFGIGTAAVQWLTTGYLLMLAIIVPASGWLKNNFSHKRLFIAAEALFYNRHCVMLRRTKFCPAAYRPHSTRAWHRHSPAADV